jgi:hypothetical protein
MPLLISRTAAVALVIFAAGLVGTAVAGSACLTQA